MKKLAALNTMLASIAQLPENSTDSMNPYAIAAIEVLNRVTADVLELGWWFNTEFNVTLTPTQSDELILPESTLRVEEITGRLNAVPRRGKLYDPIRHSSKFTDPIQVHIILNLEFEDIPNVCSLYITREATKEFFTDRDGDTSKLSILTNNATLAWHRLSSTATNQRGISAMDSPHVQQFLSRMPMSGSLLMRRVANPRGAL